MALPRNIERVSDTIWEVPPSYKEGMRVPARIYATEKLLHEMDHVVFDQITNVATLPGVTRYALCMPDGHFGYGFPIGGVAAMDVEQGARWCTHHGYGWEEDLELTEESGCIEGADSSMISDRAIDRGFNQIGTLGSGNHYLEIQVARPENH